MVHYLCVNCVRAVIMVALSVFLVAGAEAAEEKQTLTIAVLPCSDPIVTVNKFHALTSYLEHETGYDIEIYVPITHEVFESAVRLGTIDFALQSPHTYLNLANFFDQTLLLRSITREGEIFEAGAVVVRKDSGIKRIEELRGKSVMFGPRTSASKWLAPKLMLQEHGIDIDKDLASYCNGGCCEDIVFTVYMKQVDAGVICDHFLDHPEEMRAELGINYDELVVIAKTEPVPTRIFTARRGTPVKIIEKVDQALLRLDRNDPHDRETLSPLELSGFQRAKEEDYDSVRTWADQ
jgi:phosphonate transport system substrate-binding protein